MQLSNSRLLPRAVALIMFVVLCATTVYWIVRVSRDDAVSHPSVAATRPAIASDASTIKDASLLFGAAAQSQGGYRVTGIIALGEGRNAAILTDASGLTRTVSAGSRLDAHLHVRNITANSVVLDRDGVAESMSLTNRTQEANTILR